MTVRFGDTISAIIDYSKHPDSIAMSLNPYERGLIQNVLGEAQIQSVHKVLSPSTFQTIIDSVQGRIIDMFMDLDEKVFDGEIDLRSNDTKEEINQVINNYITAGIVHTGTGAIDASNSKIASNIKEGCDSELVKELNILVDKIEGLERNSNEEFDEVAQEIVNIRAELSSHNPMVKTLKKSCKAIAWGASISCKTAIEKLVNNAIDLLGRMK